MTYEEGCAMDDLEVGAAGYLWRFYEGAWRSVKKFASHEEAGRSACLVEAVIRKSVYVDEDSKEPGWYRLATPTQPNK